MEGSSAESRGGALVNEKPGLLPGVICMNPGAAALAEIVVLALGMGLDFEPPGKSRE